MPFMDRLFYTRMADQSLTGDILEDSLCQQILASPAVELLPLLTAAFEVRKEFAGREVTIHILNNAQNGFCPEDCHYCAQAKTSQSEILEYPLKSDEEILEEARLAYARGAFRYCMVFAGRGPSPRRVEHLSRLIRLIKSKYNLSICVSCGLLDEEKANVLKAAGLDRLNHNLNTSEKHYPEICTTHSYADRLNTLKAAQKAGLEICSGIIVGMGESSDDIISVAKTLRRLQSPSIPVNFFIPIPGNTVKNASALTPEYCLRVLCLFRFLNPKAEVRVAAGREFHWRELEALSLYPANSLFLDGYLNARGAERRKTLQMIKDAGFSIKADFSIEELLKDEEGKKSPEKNDGGRVSLKGLSELRPHATSSQAIG